MDLFEKCYGFTEAKQAIEAGIYPYFIPLTENEAPRRCSAAIGSSCAARTIISA